MGLLHPDIGERLAGLQLTGPGSLARPSIAWEQDPDTGIRHRGVQGEFSFISNGVEVGRVTADGFLLPLFTAGSVLFAGTSGTITEDNANFSWDDAANRLTVLNLTVSTGLTLTGATITGAPTWASSQAITLSTAAQPNVTSLGTLAANLTFTDDSFDIGASGATRPRNLFLSGDATIGDQLVVSGVGPHAVGGSVASDERLRLVGSFGGRTGLNIGGTLNPAAGASAQLLNIAGTIVEASSGTHAEFVALLVEQPTITAGAAALTNASTVKITDAPTGATNNYALWVDAGITRLDDPIALGGGATPTLGTIGGSGPAAAAQNQWLRININGTVNFIPVWQ